MPGRNGVAVGPAAGGERWDRVTDGFDPNVDCEVTAIAVQADGKIIIAIFTKVGGINRANIARLNVDGSVDLVFNWCE